MYCVSPRRIFYFITALILINVSTLIAQHKKVTLAVPDDIIFRTADIRSEGTRIQAEVFAPKNPKSDRLPTILMSHGWGGLASGLRPDAILFAQNGYLVVTIDYRGWGNSDGKLVQVGDLKKGSNGTYTAEVKEVRGIVDPIDQTTDILNALHWVIGEKLCDPKRIGIWGSSYSGGHVAYVAARDPRVKCFVSQVGSFDSRFVLAGPRAAAQTWKEGTARTRGQLDYPKPGAAYGNLKGVPIREKLMQYAPIESVERIRPECAKLYIIAEHEELFDNRQHAILAHTKSKGIKKLVVVKGIKHYGIYHEKRKEAQQLALDWYNKYLKAAK